MKTTPQPTPYIYRIMQAMIWPLLKALGISCRDAYTLSSEQPDRQLTAGETFRLQMHLMMCGLCRRLPAQFAGIRELVRRGHPHEHEEISNECLSPEAKQRIESIIRNAKTE